uniref:ANK_REP_REGION domain-containing protein n=1 Tax=Globodera pallida TaxID=36090 RepID=A0A183CM46_GLOPA
MGQSLSSILPRPVVGFVSSDASKLVTHEFFTFVLDGNIDQLRELIDTLTDTELERLLHMQFPPDGDNRGTALFIAVIRGHAEVVTVLLEEGADPLEPSSAVVHNNAERVLPLLFAAAGGHLEVCRQLVDNGADVNRGRDNGETPLQLAAFKGHLDIVVFLVEKGADINLADTRGTTPLMSASINGQTNVVQFLLSKGAHTNQRDRTGTIFALVCAIGGGHLYVCRRLVAAGVDVNQESTNGLTPLMYACILKEATI